MYKNVYESFLYYESPSCEDDVCAGKYVNRSLRNYIIVTHNSQSYIPSHRNVYYQIRKKKIFFPLVAYLFFHLNDKNIWMYLCERERDGKENGNNWATWHRHIHTFKKRKEKKRVKTHVAYQNDDDGLSTTKTNSKLNDKVMNIRKQVYKVNFIKNMYLFHIYLLNSKSCVFVCTKTGGGGDGIVV